MSQKNEWQGIKLETPGTYRIRVQGQIDNKWTDNLGGMSVSFGASLGKPPVTVLIGHLTDQAALSGVLNTLYDLQLPLLSVENLDEN